MTNPASATDGSDMVLARAPYRIGAVTLVAHDADTLARFYCDAVGLDVISREARTVRLGDGLDAKRPITEEAALPTGQRLCLRELCRLSGQNGVRFKPGASCVGHISELLNTSWS